MGDKDLKVVYPPVANNFNEINGNKVVRALSAIALEIQKFHSRTPISSHSFNNNEDLCANLSICKSTLTLKKKEVELLKDNLRKACIVAKTIMSAKEHVTSNLLNDINNIKNKCNSLHDCNTTNVKIIQLLKEENKTLHEKIQHLDRFIELGYKELQKIRNLPFTTVPTVIQLKEIMLSCGQYYADYCNEREKLIQIEQKNRFLNNKIYILSTNLEATTEKLKNLSFENSKLLKENILLKNKNVKEIEANTTNIKCNRNASLQNYNSHPDIEKFGSIRRVEHEKSFDLSSHLVLVKNLLLDQDNMLKDLRKITQEINSSTNQLS